MLGGSERLLKMVGWGFVLSVFAAGTAWRELRADTTDAKNQAVMAMATVTKLSELIEEIKRQDDEEDRQYKLDQEEIRRDIKSLQRDDCYQKWMQYRVLKKVDPASIEMIPEPRNPGDCR